MRWALLALLLSGCSAHLSPVNDCPYSRAELVTKIGEFAQDYLAAFGEDPTEHLLRVDFRCTEDLGTLREECRNAKAIACYDPPENEIWLLSAHWRDHSPVPLENTAVRHELMHATLEALEGDADGTHAAAPGPWTERHSEVVSERR